MNEDKTRKIKDRLLKELNEAIEKQASAERDRFREVKARLKKAQGMSVSLKKRKETLAYDIEQNRDLLLSTEPKKMEELSRQRAGLMGEQAVNEELIEDYEQKLIPAMETELKEAEEALQMKVKEILFGLRDVQEAEVMRIVTDSLEPCLAGWKQAAREINLAYTIMDVSPIENIKFRSTIVRDACELYARPSVIMAENEYRGGIRTE